MKTKHLKELAEILGKSWEEFGLLNWEIHAEEWLMYGYVDATAYFLWITYPNTEIPVKAYKFLGAGETKNNKTNWIEIVHWSNRFRETTKLQEDLQEKGGEYAYEA